VRQNNPHLKIAIINGPSLNLTGVRQTDVYGTKTWPEIEEELKQQFKQVDWHFFQSNVEGELINQLHQFDHICNGIIINAGGYTHTSVALGDAVAAINTPVVEVHMSNILAREAIRQISLISPHVAGVISGFGADSYHLAAWYFLNHQTFNRL
jgi:3-dehydroquinate dehydratase-2